MDEPSLLGRLSLKGSLIFIAVNLAVGLLKRTVGLAVVETMIGLLTDRAFDNNLLDLTTDCILLPQLDLAFSLAFSCKVDFIVDLDYTECVMRTRTSN